MRILLGIGLCLLPLAASAQHDPTIGPGDYPQYRNLSALSGSTYGLDERGYVSLSGPTAYSTPVAHVLGHGRWQLGVGRTSFSLLPSLDTGGSNGTAFATVGVTVGSFNIASSYMLKSTHGDQAYNVQIGLIPPRGSRLALSVGIQDIEGRGGASGEGLSSDGQNSRSFFGVMTYRIDTPRAPVFLTLGAGEHRFRNLFGSVSYQVARPMRVFLEHDGFGFNPGMLYTWGVGGRRGGPQLTTLIGLQRFRYLTISTGVGF